MKHLKQFLAFALVALLVLSMSSAAFAATDTTHTITITNADPAKAHSYEAYQVFSGEVEDGQLTKIAWGAGVDGDALLTALQEDATIGAAFAGAETPAQVAKVLEGFENDSAALDAFALLVGKNLGTVAGTSSETKSPYTISVTGDGYYFVKDVDDSLEGEDYAGESYTKYMLKVIEDETIEAKDDHLVPDKKIIEGEKKLDENSAAIGDEITFEVTIPMPKMDGYQNYLFTMSDELCDGLTFQEIKSVTVGSQTLDEDDYELTVNPTTGKGASITLDYIDFIQYKGETGKVVVTYTAILNEDADLINANENTVKYIYSNDPSKSGDGDWDEVYGETPEITTKTWVTQLKVIKIGDGDESKKLAGAEFTLTGEALNIVLRTGSRFEKSPYTAADGETVDADKYYLLKDGSYTTTAPSDLTADKYAGTDEYVKVNFTKLATDSADVDIVVVTGDDGLATFAGLKPGEYTLTETAAPVGYNTVDPITFTIAWDKDSGFSVEGESDVTYDTTEKTFKVTVDDKSGSTLPSTGGIGTTIFYVVGSLCVLVAGVLLIAKRRASNN